jgi:predicted nucleic acid-binding protein
MRVRGYLLDTCIVSVWYDETKPKHSQVLAAVKNLAADTPLAISAITLGEIEYGLHIPGGAAHLDHDEYRRWIADKLPRVLDVTTSTARLYYGPLRARLFDKYARNRKSKKVRAEQIVDPTTGEELGIDENDLWIAAQAIEHKLVLVTHDKMARIRGMARDEFSLRIEDWAAA